MTDEQYKNLLLSRYIQISSPLPGEPAYMRLRTHQHVVRLHKYNRTKESHEYIFSELLLYSTLLFVMNQNSTAMTRLNVRNCTVKLKKDLR